MASRTCAHACPHPSGPSSYPGSTPVFSRACAHVRARGSVCVYVPAEGRADDRSKRSSRCEYVIRNRPRHTATDRRCTDSTRALSSRRTDTQLAPYSCASTGRFRLRRGGPGLERLTGEMRGDELGIGRKIIVPWTWY